jgi:hypothetical protein
MLSSRMLIHTARIPKTKVAFDGLGDNVEEQEGLWSQTFPCRISHLASSEQYLPQGSSELVLYRLRANGSLSEYPKLVPKQNIVVDGVRYRVSSVRQTFTSGPDHIVADLTLYTGKQ